jgi:hypothetical protein
MVFEEYHGKDVVILVDARECRVGGKTPDVTLSLDARVVRESEILLYLENIRPRGTFSLESDFVKGVLRKDYIIGIFELPKVTYDDMD